MGVLGSRHYRFCIPHVTSDKLFGKDVTAFGTDVHGNEMNGMLGTRIIRKIMHVLPRTHYLAQMPQHGMEMK